MAYLTRLMQSEDIPQVLQIEQEAFPTQWPHSSYNTFKHELRNRLAHYIVACKQTPDKPEIIKRDANKSFWQRFSLSKLFILNTSASNSSATSIGQEYIVGYAGFWIMLDEAHLTTIAVRDAYRRRGIGELLFISVIDLATQLNAQIITLEVRVSNKAAQALYEKYHFKPTGMRPRYYSDNGEDALLMSTETITSASFQAHFQQLKEAHRQKWGEAFAYASPTQAKQYL